MTSSYGSACADIWLIPERKCFYVGCA